MNDNVDIHYKKNMLKYYNKNNMNGGVNKALIQKLAKVGIKAIKVTKNTLNQARKAALRGIKKLKKFVHDTDFSTFGKEIDEKTYYDLVDAINNIEKILEITNIKELVEKRKEFVELFIKINKVLQSLPDDVLSGEIKNDLNDIERFADSLIKKDQWGLFEK